MTLQHLGGRRLPFERLLCLVEQADVLDRDHGLAAKVCSSATSLSPKSARLGAVDGDRADQLAVAQHGYAETAAEPGELAGALQDRFIAGLDEQVDHVDHFSSAQRTGGDRRTVLQALRP